MKNMEYCTISLHVALSQCLLGFSFTYCMCDSTFTADMTVPKTITFVHLLVDYLLVDDMKG